MPTTPKKSETSMEDDVADYLSQHPDFFLNKDRLIASLNLPHNKGQAVSLVERQVSILRQRGLESRKQIDLMLETAKKNTEIFDKSQKLVMALIEAEDTDHFFAALEASLKSDFKSTAYNLLIFGDMTHQFNHFTSSQPLDSIRPHVEGLLNKPVLGRLEQKTQDFLFGDTSRQVRSAAVLPITHNDQQIGLLSIGSNKSDYFGPELETLFLKFIANALSILLPRFINPDD